MRSIQCKRKLFFHSLLFLSHFLIGVTYKGHSHHVATAIARADKVEANTILPNQTGWMGYATATVASPGVTYMGQELASSSYDLYVSLVEHYADSLTLSEKHLQRNGARTLRVVLMTRMGIVIQIPMQLMLKPWITYQVMRMLVYIGREQNL